jgi:hypothetical protein
MKMNKILIGAMIATIFMIVTPAITAGNSYEISATGYYTYGLFGVQDYGDYPEACDSIFFLANVRGTIKEKPERVPILPFIRNIYVEDLWIRFTLSDRPGLHLISNEDLSSDNEDYYEIVCERLWMPLIPGFEIREV